MAKIIFKAVCDQNGEVVERDKLFDKYNELKEKYHKPTFHCPTDGCVQDIDGRKMQTQLVACSCKNDRQNGTTAYFRTAQHQKHRIGCPYWTNEIKRQSEHDPDLPENTIQKQQKRNSNKHLVYCFPEVRAEKQIATPLNDGNTIIQKTTNNNVIRSYSGESETDDNSNTTDELAELVATYRNNPDEEITFPGLGECHIKEAFKKVSADTVHLDENGNGIDEKNKFVYIATVRKTELYGNDKDKFKFFFKERIGNYHVTIYLTKKNLIGYDYDELNNIHKQSEDKSTNKNITMYLLNPKFAKGKNAYGQDKIEIELKSMDYLYYEVETHF